MYMMNSPLISFEMECIDIQYVAPTLLLNDPVYDHTLKRVGVDIKGDEEPHFLWDGTAYMSEAEKPPTFADGKIRLPEAPRLYLDG